MLVSDEAKKLFEPVLEWLDAGAPHKVVRERELGFNMDNFLVDGAYDWTGTTCGTVCCIAGAVAVMNPQEFLSVCYDIFAGIGHVAARLGMDEEDEKALFFARRPDGYSIPNLESITPAQAAATLRHYLATGEVDWTLVP